MKKCCFGFEDWRFLNTGPRGPRMRTFLDAWGFRWIDALSGARVLPGVPCLLFVNNGAWCSRCKATRIGGDGRAGCVSCRFGNVALGWNLASCPVTPNYAQETTDEVLCKCPDFPVHVRTCTKGGVFRSGTSTNIEWF